MVKRKETDQQAHAQEEHTAIVNHKSSCRLGTTLIPPADGLAVDKDPFGGLNTNGPISSYIWMLRHHRVALFEKD